MIKKLTREIIQMIIIAFTMLLIAFVIKFIGAGGREMITARIIIVTMIYITINIFVRKRA